MIDAKQGDLKSETVVTQGEENDLTLVVEKELVGSLLVMVLDKEGAAVGGAEVHLITTPLKGAATDKLVGLTNQQGRFMIAVGPLSLQQFLDFLPDGTAYTPLRTIARFYAGQEFEFRIRLKLRAAEIPELRLGKSKLGWTTWLKTRPIKHDARVELSSEYKN